MEELDWIDFTSGISEMSLGWNFPLSDEEYKAARNWKENVVYPIILETQRGTRFESMWKVDSNVRF